ncbi:hypothetical protein AB833_05700 [Chromatiales bacterium (ex Bugula neritina AB1)]|nr:hypothetical protein AB833_05700 [Chromatiales bacterium (ex Bugula neritina AB1)]
MKISEVSKFLGVPVSTIRYYEKKKIIPKPTMVGGNRSFSGHDIKIISFVRDAQSVGFSLKEIAQLVNNDSSVTDYAEQLVELATHHRKTLRLQIEKLNKIDLVLAEMESCQCRCVKQCNISGLIGDYLEPPR